MALASLPLSALLKGLPSKEAVDKVNKILAEEVSDRDSLLLLGSTVSHPSGLIREPPLSRSPCSFE